MGWKLKERRKKRKMEGKSEGIFRCKGTKEVMAGAG
jgi:hypothetical protein